MWKTIGGFVVSNVAEVFVKELVKEISRPKKPVPRRPPPKAHTAVKPATETKSAAPLTFSKGQVMVFEWVPAEQKKVNEPAPGHTMSP